MRRNHAALLVLPMVALAGCGGLVGSTEDAPTADRVELSSIEYHLSLDAPDVEAPAWASGNEIATSGS